MYPVAVSPLLLQVRYKLDMLWRHRSIIIEASSKLNRGRQVHRLQRLHIVDLLGGNVNILWKLPVYGKAALKVASCEKNALDWTQ